MEETDQYKTIKLPSTGIFKDKGSKFFAFAYPIGSEDEALEKVQDLKEKYHDARHHCFAWRLGVNDIKYRYNDDGEPSSTAGKPIFGQIRSHGVTNVVVVVVRYFGGTKLGTGGLIQAYKESASDALTNAEIVDKTLNDYYKITFEYNDLNNVMRVIKEEGATITDQNFDLNCSMTIAVRNITKGAVMSRLEKIESLKGSFLHTR